MPNFVSVETSVAELAHGEKSHTQSVTHSLTQLIWCPGNRSFSQSIWAVSPLVAAIIHIHHRHFIITQPKGWYSFYHPTEGRRLSQPRHCSKGAQPVPKAVYCSGCRDKHKCPWWDSNLGPLTLQSDVLTTEPLRVQARNWQCCPRDTDSAKQLLAAPTLRVSRRSDVLKTSKV